EIGLVLLQRLFEERFAPGHVRVDKAHLWIDDDGVGVNQRVVRVEVLVGIGAEPFPDNVLDFTRFVDTLLGGLLIHSFSFKGRTQPIVTRWSGAGDAAKSVLNWANPDPALFQYQDAFLSPRRLAPMCLRTGRPLWGC